MKLNFSNTGERHSLPTWYARRHFRSMIEARWAVFFDLLGIRWKYEPRTFYSRYSYVAYKPDFLLPKLCLWLEVKPHEPTAREWEKIDILIEAVARKGDKVFVLMGQLPGKPEDFPEGLDFRRPRDQVQRALDVARGWRFTDRRRASRLDKW